MNISGADAKNKLPERTPVASREKRKFGTMKDRIVIHDPDWWKPMYDEELDKFIEGDNSDL